MDSGFSDIWVYLSASPLLHLFLTLLAYLGGQKLYERLGMHPLVNPVLIAVIVLVAILIVTGYSVNDTIVVFDRIRENLLRDSNRELPATVNISILEVMGRSLNTSITTALVLMSLWMLGPTSIRDFLFIMLVGVVSGTYSSIFTASQLLVSWQVRSWGSLPFSGREETSG